MSAGGRASLRAQNELSVLEFIHSLVETFDKFFEDVVRLVGSERERESE